MQFTKCQVQFVMFEIILTFDLGGEKVSYLCLKYCWGNLSMYVHVPYVEVVGIAAGLASH